MSSHFKASHENCLGIDALMNYILEDFVQVVKVGLNASEVEVDLLPRKWAVQGDCVVGEDVLEEVGLLAEVA